MRFGYEDADKYGSTGSGGSFFSLKGDGDSAVVQLLGRTMEDFPGYTVHEVEVGDKRKYINCLREAGDPVDVCPLCASRKSKPIVKLFIPLYNIDTDEVQVWERGKKFFGDLSTYCRHNKDVSKVVTEISRRGKANDTSTTYSLYEMRDEEPERDLDEFADEMPEILGRYVLDKTADDMDYYLKYDEFPSEDSGDEAPARRRSSRDEEDEAPRRRTPARRSREEEF